MFICHLKLLLFSDEKNNRGHRNESEGTSSTRKVFDRKTLHVKDFRKIFVAWGWQLQIFFNKGINQIKHYKMYVFALLSTQLVLQM